MTDQERTERRVRLAVAMGYKVEIAYTDADATGYWGFYNPDGSLAGRSLIANCLKSDAWEFYVPDFDTDPVALLSLLEWALKDGDMVERITYWGSSFYCRIGSIWSTDPMRAEGCGDTLAESLLQAIDAALSARSKEENGG
jgi:hypothetical protein